MAQLSHFFRISLNIKKQNTFETKKKIWRNKFANFFFLVKTCCRIES